MCSNVFSERMREYLRCRSGSLECLLGGVFVSLRDRLTEGGEFLVLSFVELLPLLATVVSCSGSGSSVRSNVCLFPRISASPSSTEVGWSTIDAEEMINSRS